MTRTVRLVVALQDELPRLGVETALESCDTACVVATLDSVEDLDRVLVEKAPDVLILDVRFRLADPDLLPGLATRHPAVRVIVYVAHTASECALRHLLAAGSRARLSPDALGRIDECCLTSLRQDARGCIPAEASAAEVLQAVRTVAGGQVAAAPWLSEFAHAAAGRPTPGAITPRELDVLALLGKGMSNKAIARQLGIRERTVKNHTSSLMEKLGLGSRAQVGVVAAHHNLRVISAADH
jgi:DNA-binding NarL/FixJ family response regulator